MKKPGPMALATPDTWRGCRPNVPGWNEGRYGPKKALVCWEESDMDSDQRRIAVESATLDEHEQNASTTIPCDKMIQNVDMAQAWDKKWNKNSIFWNVSPIWDILNSKEQSSSWATRWEWSPPKRSHLFLCEHQINKFPRNVPEMSQGSQGTAAPNHNTCRERHRTTSMRLHCCHKMTCFQDVPLIPLSTSFPRNLICCAAVSCKQSTSHAKSSSQPTSTNSIGAIGSSFNILMSSDVESSAAWNTWIFVATLLRKLT